MVTLAVPTLAVLQLGPCASCRAALGSVYSQGGRPAQWAPSHLPRVLELAASKAADFTAFDHLGTRARTYVKNKADMAGQRGPSG